MFLFIDKFFLFVKVEPNSNETSGRGSGVLNYNVRPIV